MNGRGNITVFFSLILTVIISLVCASVLAVKVSAGRMQAANCADQALFSLFSMYDRDLAENYGLFFIDLGMDTGTEQMGECIDFLDKAAEQVLDPGRHSLILSGRPVTALSLETTSVTACRMAGSMQGEVIASQIIDYMKQTAALSLLSSAADELDLFSSQASESESVGMNTNVESLTDIIESGQLDDQEVPAETADPADTAKAFSFINTLRKVRSGQGLSAVNLTVPDPQTVSDKSIDTGDLFSTRQRAGSIGTISIKNSQSEFFNGILVQKYITDHSSCFLKPSESCGLSYGLEYVIFGQPADRRNLEKAARRLLLIRMGINTVCLLSDPALKGEVTSAAALISTVFFSPELEPALEAALTAAWSWCESVADVRALMNDKKVPLAKNSGNWNTSLENMASVLSGDSVEYKSDAGGLGYRDYLNIFLNLTGRTDRILRFADTVEDNIRTRFARPYFRLDMCTDEMEIEMEITSERFKTFKVRRSYSYSEAEV